MAKEASPEEVIALLTKRMEQASPEHVLAVLSQAHSIEEIDQKVGPVFDRLPRELQAKVIKTYERIAAEGLVRSFKLGKEARLRDLNAIKSLTEQQLKALTIAAAHYIAADQQERLALTDPNRFVDAAQYPHGANVNRTAVRLITAHYLGYEMPRSAEGLALFDKPGVREAVQEFLAQGNPAALRGSIIMAQYTPQDVKRICKALYNHIADNIEESYKALGKDLHVRQEWTTAALRLSSRTLGWVLIALMFSNAHFPSVSDWFRKNSREYAKESIEQVYQRYDRDVRGLKGFSGLNQQTFEQERARLQQALEEQYHGHLSSVDDVRGVIVAPGDDVNAEIREAFKNRGMFQGLQEIVQRYVTPLAGLFDETYEWRKYAVQERQDFERDIYAAIDNLFRNGDFLTTLEKDKKSGIVEVQMTDGQLSKYANRTLYWTKVALKDGTKWLAGKGLGVIIATIKNLFVESFNYIWGTLTQDQQQIDEARGYFIGLAATAGSIGALILFLLLIGGPWLVGVWRFFKGVAKWVWKGGELFVSLMIMGYPKDIMTITASIRLDKLATRRVDAQASIGHKSLVDRFLHR